MSGPTQLPALHLNCSSRGPALPRAWPPELHASWTWGPFPSMAANSVGGLPGEAAGKPLLSYDKGATANRAALKSCLGAFWSGGLRGSSSSSSISIRSSRRSGQAQGARRSGWRGIAWCVGGVGGVPRRVSLS